MSTYKVRLKCENCDEESTVDVPKGTSIAEYCNEARCPNCDCTTLEKKVKTVAELLSKTLKDNRELLR